jgi:hypothetical protein
VKLPIVGAEPRARPVINYVGVTTVDKQSAGQRLGEHWFITAYIAVYIQGQYTVYNGAEVQSTVAMVGLATNQGHRQPPQYLYLHTHIPTLMYELIRTLPFMTEFVLDTKRRLTYLELTQLILY